MTGSNGIWDWGHYGCGKSGRTSGKRRRNRWSYKISHYTRVGKRNVRIEWENVDGQNWTPAEKPVITRDLRGCIQTFPDWPPGARTANGTSLCH
jgi:hypothetical protein